MKRVPVSDPVRNTARALLGLTAGALGLILVLPATLLLVPFWSVGLLTRAVGRLLARRPIDWQELIEFQPEIGWKPKPDLDAYALDLNGDAFRLTTDSAGWRGTRTISESQVVVFGDSYAFGYGIDDADFFADLLDDVRVKAIGCPGYSMVQPLLWMERLREELRGKLVVLMVYPGNDLEDNLQPGVLHYRAPFARSLNGSGRWTIVTDHVDASPWRLTSREGGIESFVEICSSGPLSRRAFAACRYLIGRARDLCDEADARLVVMTIPDLAPVARREIRRVTEESGRRAEFDEELPDREIGRICRELGVGFVALRDHLDSGDYLEHDFHWNERGHRRVARVIRWLYRERPPLAAGSALAGVTDRAGPPEGDRSPLETGAGPTPANRTNRAGTIE